MDKTAPVFEGREMEPSGKALGELVVARCDGAVYLEMAEHALDAVAQSVEALVSTDGGLRLDRGGMTGRMQCP